jgi:hypothetical protein
LRLPFPDDIKVRDRIVSKRHKIKNKNQNPTKLPDNVIPFPGVIANKEKISDLCEDLFCPSEAETEGN